MTKTAFSKAIFKFCTTNKIFISFCVFFLVAKMYYQLHREIELRKSLLKAEGEVKDVEKFWNKVLEKEKYEDIAFLSCC